MRGQSIVVLALTASVAGGLSACGGGDDSASQAPPPAADGGTHSDAAVSDATTGDAQSSGGSDAGDGAVAETDASEAGPGNADASVPSRLLLSFNGGVQSELAAFGLDSKQVDGRLLYPGFIGTTYLGPKAPWLLEQAVDVVARLDPAQPWKVASSWNVSLNDGPDGGGSYADPDAVVVSAGTKAYVLRYTRNEIAIIDPSSDGGSPIGAIDLSSELQAAGDGTVEMSAGVYVPSKQLVYVLLGNINRHDVTDDGYTLLCANTHPTVIAIDVTTDKVIDLNGATAGSGLALEGYSPGLGPGAMAYDAESDRLLVLENGCNQLIPAAADAGDGGGASPTVGPLVGREVEQLSLFTGESSTLIDLSQTGEFPSQLVYIDAHRAILQLYSTYTWDPTTPVLGPAIPNAPDAFAYDGIANLLGVSAVYGADGGVSEYDVQSVRIADGQVTKLGTNPFTLESGFIAGAQLWPAP
jgi:hypothetical protein